MLSLFLQDKIRENGNTAEIKDCVIRKLKKKNNAPKLGNFERQVTFYHLETLTLDADVKLTNILP